MDFNIDFKISSSRFWTLLGHYDQRKKRKNYKNMRLHFALP